MVQKEYFSPVVGSSRGLDLALASTGSGGIAKFWIRCTPSIRGGCYFAFLTFFTFSQLKIWWIVDIIQINDQKDFLEYDPLKYPPIHAP